MKLTIDNMIIEGTVEECFAFKEKMDKQKEDKLKIDKAVKDIFKPKPVTEPYVKPYITYKPPVYIGPSTIPINPYYWNDGSYVTQDEFDIICESVFKEAYKICNLKNYGEFI